MKYLYLCPPPFRRREGILLSCCLSVGLSVHQQFLFIFFALISDMKMKFGIQIFHNIYVKFHFGYDQTLFNSYGPWISKNSNNLQFPSIFFALVALLHILKWNLVYIFIIRISRSSFDLGTIEQFLTELCTLDFEKFQ
jgi:hypothetical protein